MTLILIHLFPLPLQVQAMTGILPPTVRARRHPELPDSTAVLAIVIQTKIRIISIINSTRRSIRRSTDTIKRGEVPTPQQRGHRRVNYEQIHHRVVGHPRRRGHLCLLQVLEAHPNQPLPTGTLRLQQLE